jgi:hypothetical protein
MGILDNLENSWDIEEKPNLAVKIFSDMVCSECESKLMPVTDNMGREIFWEDLGRPTNA